MIDKEFPNQYYFPSDNFNLQKVHQSWIFIHVLNFASVYTCLILSQQHQCRKKAEQKKGRGLLRNIATSTLTL